MVGEQNVACWELDQVAKRTAARRGMEEKQRKTINIHKDRKRYEKMVISSIHNV